MIVRTALHKRTPTCPIDDMGWPSMVMHAKAADVYYPEHSGVLSIKCAMSGEEHYEIGNNRYSVNRNNYLLLNHGQPYASSVTSESEIDSFCIFLSPALSEGVLRDLITPEDKLLDLPEVPATQQVAFFQQLYPHDTTISPLLFSLREKTLSETVESTWLQEQYHHLLQKVLDVHRNVRKEIAALPAVRHTTKIELYRRLHRGRDFIDSMFRERIQLEDSAEAAGMSRHHFLRSYKKAFQETPHQHLIRRRLEQAQYLLVNTDMKVSAICYDIGFESPGSFSTLFTKKFKISPENFRQKNRRK